MNFIEPHVEWWKETTTAQHVARVGRICYKSQGKQPWKGMTEDERLAFIEHRDQVRCNDFWQSGHRSMFRHSSAYFYIDNENRLSPYIWAHLKSSPFINYCANGRRVWISTNMQFWLECPDIVNHLKPYSCTEEVFIKKAEAAKFTDALALLRMTFVVTTQISTSRELNRTSPNAIAEQSTRYCNMEKKGGVQIATPHWYFERTRWQRLLYRMACRFSEWVYGRLLLSGMKPEDARGVLPLDTYTVVAYTYSIGEWRDIINLRYHGTTGKPHPNAKAVAGMIRDVINDRLRTLQSSLKEGMSGGDEDITTI